MEDLQLLDKRKHLKNSVYGGSLEIKKEGNGKILEEKVNNLSEITNKFKHSNVFSV